MVYKVEAGLHNIERKMIKLSSELDLIPFSSFHAGKNNDNEIFKSFWKHLQRGKNLTK